MARKFARSFIKNDIIYMNFQFIYENSILLSLLKIVALEFAMHILTIFTYSLIFILVRHWKTCFLQPRLF